MKGSGNSTQSGFQQQLLQEFEKEGKKAQDMRYRAKAWERFCEIGLPHLKTEAYRYLRMHRLYGRSITSNQSSPLPSFEDISSQLLPECEGHITFVDGHFTPHLSHIPTCIQILSLNEAIKSYSALFSNHWTQFLKREKDPFVALNAALHKTACFAYLTPNQVMKKPLQILHWTADKMACFPRFHLFAARGSSGMLCATGSGGNEVFSSGMIDVALDEGAQIQLFCIDPLPRPSSWLFSAIRATLKRDAHFSSTILSEGGETTRHDIQVALIEENAEVSLRGLTITRKKNESHTYIHIDHYAPHCRSHQQFKTIAFDQSQTSFEGKIYVHPDAQKTEAYQLNQNLVMDPRAQVNSKPNLEIFADDVKASHGATVGQVDPETLVYLQSKGIGLAEAKQLLLLGFAQEIIASSPFPIFQSRVNQAIEG